MECILCLVMRQSTSARTENPDRATAEGAYASADQQVFRVGPIWREEPNFTGSDNRPRHHRSDVPFAGQSCRRNNGIIWAIVLQVERMCEGLVLRVGIACSLLSILMGCSFPPANKIAVGKFFPFSDRPTEQITMQHDVQVVAGTVFHFLDNGSRAVHHFSPIATIMDSNTYVISIPSALDIADFMSTGFDAETDVEAVIAAAETYCESTGYFRVGRGASIWIGENSSALVEFCVPEGVQLPPSYKAGERVPRKE